MKNLAEINTLIAGRLMREEEKQQINECVDLLNKILGQEKKNNK